MEAKGTVWLNSEFKHTKIWPAKKTFPSMAAGVPDLEAHYKECLAGKICTVMDISQAGPKSYLVLGQSDKMGPFIWMIEEADTKAFIPVIKKNGVVMPANLSPIEQFAWMAKHSPWSNK